MKFSCALPSLSCFSASCICAIAQPQPGTVLWTFDVGRTIRSSLAVAPHGAVYVGSDIALYSITNNGSVASNKWTFNAAAPDSPAIGADGTVYFVGGGNNNLYAVSPAGTQLWMSSVGGGKGSPAIGLDGTVYFVADGRLYAIGSSGGSKWDCLLEWSASHWGFVQSPVCASDGTIYVALWDTLHAITAAGTNKWSANLDSIADGSAALGGDGTIFVSAGPLYAFRPDGTTLWTASPSGLQLDGPPVIQKSGCIYAAGYQSHILYALTPAGEMLWQASGAGAPVNSTAPAIDRAGNIHYCVSNSIVALNARGEMLWTVYAGYTIPVWYLSATSPVIGSDGTLYAALGSKVYAVATGTNGPADSPWPMYRGNARHTGKIEKPAVKPPQKRSDANFDLQVYAQVGKDCSLESSTNLDVAPWTTWTNFLTTNVPMDIADLTASNSPVKFYRAVEKP